MKIYSYLIDGKTSPEAFSIIKQELDENKIDGVSFSFSDDPSSITAVIDSKITSVKNTDIENVLVPLFEKHNLKLILPANAKNFSFVGSYTKKEEKRFSLKTLISAIVITLVISVLFTYVFASGILRAPSLYNPSGNQAIDISDATYGVEILNKIFSQLEFDYEKLDKDKLADFLLKAYIEASGDKYAVYYNAEEYADWLESQKGNSAGIGIMVTKSEITINGSAATVIEILYVHSNSPASKADLCAGDYIYAVQKDNEKVLVNDVGYDIAVDLLLGEIGTDANVSIYRKAEDGTYEEKDITATRNVYESDTVFGSICETNSKVGIVKLLSFGLKTPKQFSQVVDSLINQGCEYFVFDLRSNPGGDLNAIKAILSYFLNEGDLILSVEYSDGTKKEHFAKPVQYKETDAYFDCSISSKDIGKYKNLKFNILTDENTASAAELFTATVRDYNLGKIIGEEHTYGKGCMQSIIPLSSYGLPGGLRVTTSMYFSMSRTIYHDVGIVPDIVEPLSSEARKYSPYNLPHEIDNQLQLAINELLK